MGPKHPAIKKFNEKITKKLFTYWVFHEKSTPSYLCELGIDICIVSIERVYTPNTIYLKSAIFSIYNYFIFHDMP